MSEEAAMSKNVQGSSGSNAKKVCATSHFNTSLERVYARLQKILLTHNKITGFLGGVFLILFICCISQRLS
jgi:hypothetical protein